MGFFKPWGRDGESIRVFLPAGIGKTTVSASIGDTCATVEIQVVSSTAGKIYVGNTSGDFKTIQSAVDFSHDGDTIVVMNGTYRENVFIDHPVTIVSENGPDATIVERGDQNAYAFTVQASDVTISGLGINGNIILKDGKYSNLIVDSNAITDGGICLSGVTSNNTIINNSVITTSSLKGIDVKPSSNNNTICKNFVSTDMFGLFIDASSEGHIIADNTFNTSSKCFAYNSTFSNNTFLDGGTWYTQETLYLSGNGNSLTNNTIRSTQRLHALKLTGANLVVTANTLKGGTSKVIDSDGVSNVVFCMNNLIKVNASSYFSFGSNLNSTAPVTYYYNGSEYTGYLGNFWDGFSALDEDGNGILDVPYAPEDAIITRS
jgi:nitrous oxidase accessory protein NosD